MVPQELYIRDLMYSYADKGIVTIPVNEKKPVINEWNTQEVDLSYERIDRLFENKFKEVTGLAVLIGESNPGLSCVDIDCNDSETIKSILEILPSHINKYGKKGCSFFFRAEDQQGLLKFPCKAGGFVEVFYSNKYVVIPPSVHTKGEVISEDHHYSWVDESCTLLSVNGIDDLPFIDHDQILNIEKIVGGVSVEKFNKNNPIQVQYDSNGMADGRYNAIGMVIGSYIKRHNGIINISEIVELILKFDSENHHKNSFFTYAHNKKHKEIKPGVSKELNAHAYVQAFLISIEKREKLYFAESKSMLMEKIEPSIEQFRPFIEIKDKTDFSEVFTVEMIPPLYRKFCIDLAASFGVALHVVFYPLLAAHAGILQSKIVIRPHKNLSFIQRPNLGVVLLADSGSKKSDILKLILWRVRQINDEIKNANPKDMLEEMSGTEKRIESLSKAKNKAYEGGETDVADQLIREIYGLQDKLDAIQKKMKPSKLMYHSATVQKIIKDHSDNCKGGLFFTADEFSTYLAIMNKKGNEEFRSYMMECLNGDGMYTSSTLSRGDDVVDPCFASVLSTLQPAVYKTKIDDLHNPRMTENDGFWQRYIFVNMGRPSLDRSGQFNVMGYKKEYDLFDHGNDLHFREISIREDALSFYDECRRRIEIKADSYHDRTVLKSFLAKHEGRLCKYAFLAEWFMSNGRCLDISKEAIEYAMKWLEYEGNNTIHQFQSHDKNEDFLALSRIIDQMLCGILVDGETLSKWQQNLRGVFRSMSEFTRYIRILENHGYVSLMEINGKSKIVNINPMVRANADKV